VASAVREIPSVGKSNAISAYQDDINLHWAPESEAEITKSNFDFIRGAPTYSPDLNCIENIFKETESGLWLRQVESPTRTKEEWISRFKEEATKLGASGYIGNLQKSMPRRMAAVIKAGGGPTKY
jgi:hypothetical protein